MMISYTSFESVVQLRTIFITGLPDDVKERELLNLLRWLPGYEASQVNFKGEKAHGFFSFLHGSHLVFDAESKSVIHTEMAKKNLFVKIVDLVQTRMMISYTSFESVVQLRTIFITGLPDDVKERELLNLLRWLPGYEASQVNFKGEKAHGFFSFLHGSHLVFDAESKSVIHTEMAKKNLFVKIVVTAHSVYSPSPFHHLPPPVWGPPHGYMASTPPPYDTYAGYHAPSVPMPPPTPVAAPSSYVPVQNAKDNPPCNTLFIGNLPENINEEELWSLLSSQPGFNQMKILRQERHTVCFIEFEDVNSATNVHHNLQGAVIPSSGQLA
ncbi:hypothetical protein Bca52824_065735 [Brassica carinata]|uniref:RRM domain-containing protein n=1 Tax=Brassica carinata TaxID=52824 RepID=A0A8X7QMK4_BRACI|nr:hypothetical protein Bca52824_065735 [Brassica carinata]